MGAMGGAPLCQFQLPSWVRGIHSGEARTLGVGKNNRPWANPPKAGVHAGTIGSTIGKTTGNSSQTLLAFYRIFGLSWEIILSQ